MTTNEIKNKYFRENEEILWQGKPEKIRFFSKKDIIIIPLTTIIGAYFLLYAAFSFMMMIEGKSMTFALSGITILLVALYLLFGRIWYRYRKLSKNLYFVTSSRVFVFNTLRNIVTADIPLELTKISCLKNDVYLSSKLLGGDIACALGIDLFLYNIIRESPAFYGIENPEDVMKIIERAKKHRKNTYDDSEFI